MCTCKCQVSLKILHSAWKRQTSLCQFKSNSSKFYADYRSQADNAILSSRSPHGEVAMFCCSPHAANLMPIGRSSARHRDYKACSAFPSLLAFCPAARILLSLPGVFPAARSSGIANPRQHHSRGGAGQDVDRGQPVHSSICPDPFRLPGLCHNVFHSTQTAAIYVSAVVTSLGRILKIGKALLLALVNFLNAHRSNGRQACLSGRTLSDSAP